MPGKELIQMKRRLAAIICTAAVLSNMSVFADSVIPDHCGTPTDSVKTGTEPLNTAVKSYTELFKSAGNQYGVDPNLLAAICMQESSGRNVSYREDGSEYPAWGIMQIEYTHEKSFGQFGLDTTGKIWTLSDRLDPEKAVPYAAWVISRSLIAYDCDYMKTVQAYNFGQTVLDRIISASGDNWLNERKNAAKYADNWKYDKYGDAEYIEHVLRYYHNDIEYLGAKVRINDELVAFDDQYPIIIDGFTLVPIRNIAEILGADVEWDHDRYAAVIEKNNSRIEIPIGKAIATVNGKTVTLDAKSCIINDRTLVPFRFIAESLGVTVGWDEESRTVFIKRGM